LSFARAIQGIKYLSFHVVSARSKAVPGGQQKVRLCSDWSGHVHRLWTCSQTEVDVFTDRDNNRANGPELSCLADVS